MIDRLTTRVLINLTIYAAKTNHNAEWWHYFFSHWQFIVPWRFTLRRRGTEEEEEEEAKYNTDSVRIVRLFLIHSRAYRGREGIRKRKKRLVCRKHEWTGSVWVCFPRKWMPTSFFFSSSNFFLACSMFFSTSSPSAVHRVCNSFSIDALAWHRFLYIVSWSGVMLSWKLFAAINMSWIRDRQNRHGHGHDRSGYPNLWNKNSSISLDYFISTETRVNTVLLSPLSVSPDVLGWSRQQHRLVLILVYSHPWLPWVLVTYGRESRSLPWVTVTRNRWSRQFLFRMVFSERMISFIAKVSSSNTAACCRKRGTRTGRTGERKVADGRVNISVFLLARLSICRSRGKEKEYPLLEQVHTVTYNRLLCLNRTRSIVIHRFIRFASCHNESIRFEQIDEMFSLSNGRRQRQWTMMDVHTSCRRNTVFFLPVNVTTRTSYAFKKGGQWIVIFSEGDDHQTPPRNRFFDPLFRLYLSSRLTVSPHTEGRCWFVRSSSVHCSSYWTRSELWIDLCPSRCISLIILLAYHRDRHRQRNRSIPNNLNRPLAKRTGKTNAFGLSSGEKSPLRRFVRHRRLAMRTFSVEGERESCAKSRQRIHWHSTHGGSRRYFYRVSCLL